MTTPESQKVKSDTRLCPTGGLHICAYAGENRMVGVRVGVCECVSVGVRVCGWN